MMFVILAGLVWIILFCARRSRNCPGKATSEIEGREQAEHQRALERRSGRGLPGICMTTWEPP